MMNIEKPLVRHYDALMKVVAPIRKQIHLLGYIFIS